MGRKLPYKATCEYCSRTIEVTAYTAFGANNEIQRHGWETIGETLEESQHYCPDHKSKRKTSSFAT